MAILLIFHAKMANSLTRVKNLRNSIRLRLILPVSFPFFPSSSQFDHPVHVDFFFERVRLLSSFRRRRENESLHLHFTRLKNTTRYFGGK